MIFRPEMVKAIYDGRKTETRRVASENPNSPWYRDDCAFYVGRPGGYAISPGRSKNAVGRLELTEEPRLDVLEAMTDEDGRREGFEGFIDFRAYFERLHGRFDPLLKVWVVSFRPIEWNVEAVAALLAELKEAA